LKMSRWPGDDGKKPEVYTTKTITNTLNKV